MKESQILNLKPSKKWEFREYKKGGLIENGIALNETGLFIYKLCDGKREVKEIIDAVFEKYEVDNKTATDDTIKCLKVLLDEEAIE